jgi:pyruvate dehydrogenase phosphatase
MDWCSDYVRGLCSFAKTTPHHVLCSKDDPSAISDGIRKDLDKLGKHISNLPDAPGGDNELSALEKISEDLELLGKGLEEFQKSIEALRKDTDEPQSDDDQVVHRALTTMPRPAYPA